MCAALQPGVIAKLMKELRSLQQNEIDGVQVFMSESNIADIQAEYEGPSGTPYEGGVFRMKLVLGNDYPNAPPKGFFTTKLFHPNVSSDGEICVNVLKRDWTPDMGLRHILTVIRCLLIEPNPESALNEEAGKLLLESFADFAKKARLLTEIHAKKPSILTATGGANALNAESNVDGKPAGGATQAKHKLAGRPAGVDRKKSLRRL